MDAPRAADERSVSRPRGARPEQRQRPATWWARWRLRTREQRGAAIVEAAFITPVFIALVLGVIEIGLAMNDYLAVSSTVRSSARSASAYGADLYSDYGVLQTMKGESAALDQSKINYIVIYKPSAFGEAPSPTCQTGTPSAGAVTTHANACNVYTPSSFNRPKTDFGCLTTQNLDRYWCPTVRKVTEATTAAGDGPDYVGVWISYDHNWVTKMFGNTKTFTDQSVVRLEPRTK
jgi:Flp pilus assembly protein TadG